MRNSLSRGRVRVGGMQMNADRQGGTFKEKKLSDQ
jgi:hypothetical protein